MNKLDSIGFKLNIRIMGAFCLVFLVLAGVSVNLMTQAVRPLTIELLEHKLGSFVDLIQKRYKNMDDMGLTTDKDTVAKYQRQLMAEIRQFKYKKTGVVYIVDSTGTAIVHTGGKEGRDFSGEDFIKRMRQNSRGEIEYVYDGVKVTAVYQTFEPWKWIIAVKMQDSEIYEGMSGFVLYYILICLAALLVITLLSVYFIQSVVVQPVTSTAGMLHDIAEGEGDLTKRLKVSSRDEIGELCVNFNRFADKIHALISQVKGGAQDINVSSSEINATTHSQAAGASEQSSSVNEASTTVKELAATATQ
ncbi:MAG: Cache 3/Cache 2 fusion domain-containing protein, partial [Candidatus Omnitrophica bacterium]|nr:Cache 3/Cache 2 fusion domain-containing protein [Candidatus Omnitrophota bacterium]